MFLSLKYLDEITADHHDAQQEPHEVNEDILQEIWYLMMIVVDEIGSIISWKYAQTRW